jgi:hypothetical protein
MHMGFDRINRLKPAGSNRSENRGRGNRPTRPSRGRARSSTPVAGLGNKDPISRASGTEIENLNSNVADGPARATRTLPGGAGASTITGANGRQRVVTEKSEAGDRTSKSAASQSITARASLKGNFLVRARNARGGVEIIRLGLEKSDG